MPSQSSDVTLYEVTCSKGQLRSSRRSTAGLGVYGSNTWTIRVGGALSSSEGAQSLQAALERICKD